MILNFVVPGFSKCGTTSLCALLNDHPDIFIPGIKEPNFFAFNYNKGWDHYESLFEGAHKDQLLGDGSTFYSAAEFAELAATRIAANFPNIRLLFIARHPIRRIESSFREIHHSGSKFEVDAPFSIGQALKSLPIIPDTLYWERINSFRSRIPDKHIHVLFLEDLHQNPAKTLAGCFRFLGVDSSISIKNQGRRLNAGSTKYYDTLTIRYFRKNRWFGRIWHRIPANRRDEFARLLRLRRRFSRRIEWDEETWHWLVAQIAPDARQFLEYCGKARDFWSFDFPTASLRS